MFARGMSVLVCALTIAGLAGCGSSGTKHPAYVTIPSTNQVLGFNIDDKSGSLSPIAGSPYSAGPSPMVATIHPSRKFLYVANSQENDISLFTIGKDGGLTEVMPRAKAGVAPLALAMDANGAFLYAANESSGSISAYAINSSTGALAPVGSSLKT